MLCTEVCVMMTCSSCFITWRDTCNAKASCKYKDLDSFGSICDEKTPLTGKRCDFQYPDHGLPPTPSGSDRSFPPLGVDEGHSPYECLKTRIHFGRRWWSLGFHGNWWSGRASPGSHVWSIPLLVLMSIESMFSYKLEAFLYYGFRNPADLWKTYAILCHQR